MIATAQATQNQTPSVQLHTAAKATPAVSRFDTDDLPSLAEIRAGGTYLKAKNLDDKSLSEVLKGVKDFDLGDEKSLTDFAIERRR